jgi:hypothetical protein
MENEVMKKIKVFDSLGGRYVFLEVAPEIYDILKRKVIKRNCSTEKMQLLQTLKIDLDKLMETSITDEMVNEAVNEVVNNLKKG